MKRFIKNVHNRVHKRIKKHAKKTLNFLEALRIYGGMPVGV